MIVVVACDGDVKDGPEQGRRLEELRASAAILGADKPVHLGYADSGHGPVLYEDPPGRTRFARVDVEEAAGRLAALLAEEQRLAEEAAQRAAQRRQAFEDAERTVASTAAAAAEAGAAEDQLEAEVRDLEQRLTQAREDLAAARMRARRAESAERRARQALDRLPGQA